MPVVISYEDVQALGDLAFKTGRVGAEAQGDLQNRALGASIEAGRESTAARLQQIQSTERLATDNRIFQGQQADINRDFRREQLANADDVARRQFETGLAAAGIREQQLNQREQFGAQTQRERDERLHQQNLEAIRAKNQGGRAGGGVLNPAGVPDKKFADQEAQQFGNMIPFDTAGSVSPDQAARNQGRYLKTAQGLSALPTNQLQQYVQSGNIDQKWTPYVQAILQARQQVSGGAPVGANANGRSLPNQGQRGSPSFTQGQGLADEYSNLSDAELQQRGQMMDQRLFNMRVGGP